MSAREAGAPMGTAHEQFLELILRDRELLSLEFEAIIASSWPPVVTCAGDQRGQQPMVGRSRTVGRSRVSVLHRSSTGLIPEAADPARRFTTRAPDDAVARGDRVATTPLMTGRVGSLRALRGDLRRRSGGSKDGSNAATVDHREVPAWDGCPPVVLVIGVVLAPVAYVLAGACRSRRAELQRLVRRTSMAPCRTSTSCAAGGELVTAPGPRRSGGSLDPSTPRGPAPAPPGSCRCRRRGGCRSRRAWGRGRWRTHRRARR